MLAYLKDDSGLLEHLGFVTAGSSHRLNEPEGADVKCATAVRQVFCVASGVPFFIFEAIEGSVAHHQVVSR